jgi:MFS family permease
MASTIRRRPTGGTYAALLALPGVRRLVGAAVVARLQLGMMSLTLLLLVRESGYSYADAGAVVAVYAIVTAVAVPVVASIIDARGQRTVLVFCALAFPVSLALVYAAVALREPLAIVLAPTAIAGLTMPPISPCIRALWPRLAPSELLHSGFALESVVQELVFIMGPLIVVATVQLASPAVAVAVAATTAAAGTLVFATTDTSSIAPRRSSRPPGRWWAAPLAIFSLLAFDAAMGLTWGCVQVAMPAYNDEHGAAGLGGIALAAMGVGSLCGGLLSGMRSGADPRRDLLLSSLGITAALALAPIAPSPTAMVLVMLVAGVPMAPALASLFAMVAGHGVRGRETQAFAWLTTALVGGMSGGLAFTGLLVEHGGAMAALVALPITGGLVVVAAVAVRRRPC